MKSTAALAFLLVVLMFTSTLQAAYTINRLPVCESSGDQTNPDIDGDIIVWQSSDTDIYWKQVEAVDPNVLMIPSEQVEPKVSDGVIVWLDKSDSDHDVYGYDVMNQSRLTFTENDTYMQREHDISDGVAAYRDNSAGAYDIYTHPIGGWASPVASASSRYEFAMDGSIIAWVEVAGGGPQIFVRDVSTTDAPLQITTGSNWHRDPAVSGRLVVWNEDSGDGTYDIYGYDLDDSVNGVFPIYTGAGSQVLPVVSENIVVWQDESDGANSYDIWAKDLADVGSTAFEVSDGTGDNQNPAISGNTIVWQHKGENWDIYSAELLVPSRVTVTYPNGGESIEAATSMTIAWDSAGPVSDVLIEFSLDGGINWVEVDTVANTGSYLWNPVADVESGDCLIAVTNVDDPSATDVSDAAFEIFRIPDSIQVTGPNGGEMFLASSAMDISWAWVGEIANVKIVFSSDSGQTWQTVVASTPNDGNYTWPSSADVDSQVCSILIADAADIGTGDVSDAPFTVFQCDTALTADLTGDCYVDMRDIAEMSRQWLTCGNLYSDTWCIGQ